MEVLVGIIIAIMVALAVLVCSVIYLIFKSIQFTVQATNLYKKMIERQDMMIKLLTDIRKAGVSIPDNTLASVPSSRPRKTSVEHLVTEEGSIAEHAVEGAREPLLSEAITQEELENLKRAAGKDATNFAYLTETEWTCVCGTHNPLDSSAKIQTCSTCRRNRNYVLDNFGQAAFSRPGDPE